MTKTELQELGAVLGFAAERCRAAANGSPEQGPVGSPDDLPDLIAHFVVTKKIGSLREWLEGLKKEVVARVIAASAPSSEELAAMVGFPTPEAARAYLCRNGLTLRGNGKTGMK